MNLKLVNPAGVVRWEYSAVRGPVTIRRIMANHGLMDGTWRWIVSGVDGAGRSSQMERRFRVNKTLGFLTVSRHVMRVRPRVGGRARIGFSLEHKADVKVTVTRRGGLVRTLTARAGMLTGRHAFRWNGRNRKGAVVQSGRFVATVRARNDLGRVLLTKRFLVQRTR